MKRFLSLILCLALILSLTACTGGGGGGNTSIDGTTYGSTGIQTFSKYAGATCKGKTSDNAGYVYTAKVSQLFSYVTYLVTKLGFPTEDDKTVKYGEQLYHMNYLTNGTTTIQLLIKESDSTLSSESSSLEVLVYPSEYYK